MAKFIQLVHRLDDESEQSLIINVNTIRDVHFHTTKDDYDLYINFIDGSALNFAGQNATEAYNLIVTKFVEAKEEVVSPLFS